MDTLLFNAKTQSREGAPDSESGFHLCVFATWRLCVEKSSLSVKSVKSVVPFLRLRLAALGFLCFFAATVHSGWRSAGCMVSPPGRDGRAGGSTLHQAGLIGRFSHFCEKSAQVPFYEQLTTKITPFQLRLIKVN
jgi:hypothetical protein